MSDTQKLDHLAEARAHLAAADADPTSPFATGRLLAAVANATIAVAEALQPLTIEVTDHE